jgi:hypothetical protein
MGSYVQMDLISTQFIKKEDEKTYISIDKVLYKEKMLEEM